MTKTISIFNNKGGVGKTTYMYHVAHLLSRLNLTVLMVDCDSQCNLTAYSIGDADVKRAWSDTGNSIYQFVAPLVKGVGDIRNRAPTNVADGLYLIPGDLRCALSLSARLRGNEGQHREQAGARHHDGAFFSREPSGDPKGRDKIGGNLGGEIVGESVLATVSTPKG